jgi:hypothetical protein
MSARVFLGSGVSDPALSINTVLAAEWPLAGDPGTGGTITIDKHEPNLLVAPASVGFTLDFDASDFDTPAPAEGVIYDRRMHEIHVFWTITGGTLPAWDKTAHYLNVAWQDPNIGIGPFLRRMLPAGTWTIEAYCVEPASGKTATATTSITILDADDYYGSNQIIVSANNNFTDAPVGTRVTSIAAAWTAWYGKTVPWRVLLKRGEDYDASNRNFFDADTSTQSHFHLGAWGSGARPIMRRPVDGGAMVRARFGYDDAGRKDFRVEQINFVGTGDPTTQTGVGNETAALGVDESGIGVSSVNLMVTDCLFSGLSTAVSQQGDNSALQQDQHIDNCSLTDHSGDSSGAGFTIVDYKNHWGGWLAVTGNYGVQNPQAIDGASSPYVVASAFLRSSTAAWTHIEGNDLFQKTIPQSQNTPHQPVLRLGTGWMQDGGKVNLSRNVFEGGDYVVSFINGGAAKRAPRLNAVFDSNIFVATYATNYAIGCLAGGLTARNNMMFVPGGRSQIWTKGFFNVGLEQTDTSNDALDTPNKFYNNTLVNLRTTAENVDNTGNNRAIIMAQINATYVGSVEENNVNHQPNINTPITTFGPIDTATVLFTPWCIGAVPPPGGSVNTAYAPTSPVYLSAPLAGSPALGAALGGMTAEADIRGVTRPTYPSAGAFEAGF